MTALNEPDPFPSGESSEDSFEELKEIESQLYSVIHYNNLSESVPSDLPEGFKIDISKSNELTVSLTDINDVSDCKSVESSDSAVADETNSVSVNNIDPCNLNKSNETEIKISSELLACEKIDDDDVIFIGTSSLVSDSFTQTGSKYNIEHSKYDVEKNKIGTKTDLSNQVDSSNCFQIECNSSDDLQNSLNKSSKTIDSNDLTTNVNYLEKDKHIQEIVISDDDQRQVNRNCTPGKNKVKGKKHKIKTKKMEKNCPKKWNSAMVKYYCKISRKKLNFDVGKLRKEMREAGGNWFLNDKDLSGRMSKRMSRRCLRCKQFDHDVKHCTEPVKPITCYMCGETGHRENRCPQRKCLTCGRSNPVYVQMCSRCLGSTLTGQFYCTICHSTSHQENVCPDIWRSFHLTTGGPIVIPLNINNTKKVCCNCGRSGHLDYECNELNNSVYVVSKPFVDNYIAAAQVFALDKDNLTVNIRLTFKEGTVLSSRDGYDFLQNLSNKIQARLELTTESSYSFLTVNGSQTQCEAVIDRVHSFVERELFSSVSFHKHKKKSPSKKRRTL